MKIIRWSLLPGLLFLYSTGIIAQKDTVNITPGRGEVTGRIFADFYTGIGKGDKSSAFEVRRAYFGYKAPLSHHFSAEVKLHRES